jgi:phosphatidate cytidylyltransferase
MLLTRVLTAVVLLILLLAVLYSQSFLLFLAVSAAFLAAAMWESARLFQQRRPALLATLWTLVFVALSAQAAARPPLLLFALCLVIWGVRFVPALRFGLPAMVGAGNRLLAGLYSVTVLGCFVAIVVLFQHSPLYLVSVLALVWLADIGAYFAGKAFGRRKLAPAISPGKSWEGAIGGWLVVLAAASLTIGHEAFRDTFATQMHTHFGWLGLFGLLTLVVAASIVGDLFESQLKRRAGVKDSSALLPGHGGVLDRIDALVPVLPLAVVTAFWA